MMAHAMGFRAYTSSYVSLEYYARVCIKHRLYIVTPLFTVYLGCLFRLCRLCLSFEIEFEPFRRGGL